MDKRPETIAFRIWGRFADWAGERATDTDGRRGVVHVALVGVLIGTMSATYGLVRLGMSAPRIPVALVLAAAAVAFLGVFSLRRSGRVGGVPHAYAASMVVLFVGGALFRGAVLSPPSMLAAAVPLAVTLVLGTRAGIAWLVVVLGCVGGLLAAARLGVLPADPVSPEDAAPLEALSLGVFVMSIFVIGVIFDLERRRESEDRSRAERERTLAESRAQLARAGQMAAIGELAAGAAHEINNPLSYLITNLALLETRMGGDAESIELLSDAAIGARQIEAVIRDLKTYARTDDDETIDSIDLHDILGGVAKMISRECRHRARIIESYGATQRVIGNETRLRQIFLNVAMNSAQAIEPGHVEDNSIVISTRDEGSEVVAAVTDTGAGIDPAHLEKIFQPFFTTKPVGVGTGLGLPVCRNLVEKLGGTIRVSSELGRGTTVEVRLPGSRAVALPVAEEPPVASQRRVLIVDDDELVARSVRRLLRGYDIRVVNGGREALELIESDAEFDAVLCDLMMPELTGMELYDALLGARPDLAARFIFMTGGAFTEAAADFRTRVPNLFLDKPLHRDRLLRAIEEQVGRG